MKGAGLFESAGAVKDELGWADFQVRSDIAIRRHQTLVNCAFSFCWDAWFADETQAQDQAQPPETADGTERGPSHVPPAPTGQLAQDNPRGPSLARPLAHPSTLLERVVEHAPTTRTASHARLVGHRPGS